MHGQWMSECMLVVCGYVKCSVANLMYLEEHWMPLWPNMHAGCRCATLTIIVSRGRDQTPIHMIIVNYIMGSMHQRK